MQGTKTCISCKGFVNFIFHYGFCFTLRVDLLFGRLVMFSTNLVNRFYFPLPPGDQILFYTTVVSILFYTMGIFPPCFTLWVNSPCFTLWGYIAMQGHARYSHARKCKARSCHVRKNRIRPIFRSLVERYF